MFDILKKKIGGFIDNLVKKGDEKKEEPSSEQKQEQIQEKKLEPKIEQEKKAEERIEKTAEPKKEKPIEQTLTEKPEQIAKSEPIPPKIIEKKEPKPVKPVQKPSEPEKKIEPTPKPVKKPEEIPKPKEIEETEYKEVPKIKEDQKIEKKEEQKINEEPKPKEVKVGILKQVTSIFTGEIEISEKEVEELLENLELELLESDVAIEVADEIKTDLKNAIVGKKIKRGELNQFVKQTIKHTLKRIVSSEKGFDILERLQSSERPMKIVFLGVNGAGKTTTIAKVAKLLMSNGFTVAVASADTFRAAAIEQMQVHADRLGIRNIKRTYGSDPTAVAYDAVNYAKAHNIDAILIDTAGRQETNLNLINELKKMERVIQPHIKVYVGESIAGNAILSQVEEFNEAIGIDGVILTKLDCDAKGGTVLSITKATGIPIVYIGTGQTYEDIEKFDSEKIIERILN